MAGPSTRTLSLFHGLDSHLYEWDTPGSDHTVILVHGFLDLAYSWNAVVEAGFGDGLHVVAPDMRGHGRSGRATPGGYYHFMDYVADLHSIIEQVGRDRVSLVGHSMGGAIVSYFAGSYPARIHRLGMLEGLGPPEQNSSGPERARAWISGWQRQANSRSRSYPSAEAAAERLRKLDPLLSEELSLDLAREGTRATESGVQFRHDPIHLTQGPYAFQLAIAKSFWEQISCPTLFVDGSESTFRAFEPQLSERKQCFKDQRSVTLEGAAHMMMRHKPRELAQLLQQFVCS